MRRKRKYSDMKKEKKKEENQEEKERVGEEERMKFLYYGLAIWILPLGVKFSGISMLV
jgi:hypothetical protein